MQQGAVMQTADTGQRYHFIPVLAAYIADLLKTANVLNVRAYPGEFSEPNFLVPKASWTRLTSRFRGGLSSTTTRCAALTHTTSSWAR